MLLKLVLHGGDEPPERAGEPIELHIMLLKLLEHRLHCAVGC